MPFLQLSNGNGTPRIHLHLSSSPFIMTSFLREKCLCEMKLQKYLLNSLSCLIQLYIWFLKAVLHHALMYLKMIIIKPTTFLCVFAFEEWFFIVLFELHQKNKLSLGGHWFVTPYCPRFSSLFPLVLFTANSKNAQFRIVNKKLTVRFVGQNARESTGAPGIVFFQHLKSMWEVQGGKLETFSSVFSEGSGCKTSTVQEDPFLKVWCCDNWKSSKSVNQSFCHRSVTLETQDWESNYLKMVKMNGE